MPPVPALSQESVMDFEVGLASAEESLSREADSLDLLLRRLRGRISPVLIGDREWEKVLELAGRLPTSMAAFPFGFEFPLHESAPRANFAVSVIGGGQSAAFLQNVGQAEGAGRTAQSIASLLAELGNEESDLRRVAGRKLLLEYEIEPARESAQSDPGFFLCPAPDVLAGDGRRSGDLAVVLDAVSSATGRDPDIAERREIERVYRAMEPETSVRGVGVFPSRGPGVRLAIEGFRDSSALMAFLERAAWPGRRSVVASTVAPLEERAAFTWMGVQLDLRPDGVGPRLGLDFFPEESDWLKDIRPWRAFIEGIGAQGLAVPERLSALAESWPGAEMLFGKTGLFLHLRGIHHFELGLAGDEFDQVKAYAFLLIMGSRSQE